MENEKRIVSAVVSAQARERLRAIAYRQGTSVSAVVAAMIMAGLQEHADRELAGAPLVTLDWGDGEERGS